MKFEIIDFHTHPFLTSSEILNDYIRDNLSIDTVLEDMDNAGVGRFCGSVIMPHTDRLEDIKKANRDALTLREKYNGRYIPGFHISPRHIEGSIEELKFAHENGVRLIGELVPYHHGWEDYSCEEFSVLLDEMERYDMAVSLHVGEFEQMEKMARKHRNVRFVIAHPGEIDRANNHIELMKKCDNVCLDLSGGGIHRWGAIEYLVNKLGAERILFGSDYPICGVGMYVAAVMEAKISDTAKELIFSENAKRILGK